MVEKQELTFMDISIVPVYLAAKQSEKWTQLNYTTRITIIKEREREGERREEKRKKEKKPG